MLASLSSCPATASSSVAGMPPPPRHLLAWRPPRRPYRARRRPVDARLTSPSSPLLSRSPLLDFIADRKITGAHRRGQRGHDALELKLLCPSYSSSSTSSPRSRWSRDLDSSRHNRPRALAGSATRRRQILRLRSLPDSVDYFVVFPVAW